MCCVAAKLVLRLLTDEQKQRRDTVSQPFGRMLKKTFLKNIITVDETRAYGYDVKTKVQSQWMGKLSPRPKEARQIRTNVKVISIFFY
jgi:hypothetical protein